MIQVFSRHVSSRPRQLALGHLVLAACALAAATPPASGAPASENYTLDSHNFGGAGGSASSANVDGFFVLGEWAVGEASSANLSLVAGLLSGASGDGAPGSDIVVQVSNYPAEVPLGGVLTWTVTIANLGEADAGFDGVRVDVSGPVTTSVPLYAGSVITLPPGGRLARSVDLQVPGNAPLGVYTLATVVSLEADDLASDSFDTTVIP
jgi:hypothetical protein